MRRLLGASPERSRRGSPKFHSGHSGVRKNFAGCSSWGIHLIVASIYFHMVHIDRDGCRPTANDVRLQLEALNPKRETLNSKP